jgi:hypothetical protein
LDTSMAGTRILRALGVDADERATTDAHDPLVQLPLPTLDERASVYLRAVHGERDFTNEEHANARDLILEAMAADIAARDTWTRDVAARAVMTRDVMARDVAATNMEARSVGRSPNAVLQDFEPMRVPGLAGDQDIDQSIEQNIDQSIDQSSDDPQDAAPVFSQLRRRSFLSESRMLYGITAVSSAAALAAALGYWAGTLSQTARSSPESYLLASQASPADPSGRTQPGSDPRVVAEAQRELASALNVARLGPDEIAVLLNRGQELVAQGRFRVARLVLEQAAEAKSAAAALALGQTYDPLIERSAVRPDAPPDIAMARIWYEKAKDLGSPEAAQRLSQLRAAAALPAPRSAPK